jgi:uncharacterized protein YcbK (DUF882 family)
MRRATVPLRNLTFRRIASIAGAVVIVALVSGAVRGSAVAAALTRTSPKAAPRAVLVNLPVVSHGSVSVSSPLDAESLTGRSGRLRLRVLALDEIDAYPALVQRLGDVIRTPGVHPIPASHADSSFAIATLTPWQRKLGSYVNGYNMGFWPGERRLVTAQYENPEGFIEVSREAAATRLSTHFALRDFLTHDQEHVWPKYVVVREDLIDKLELVLESLQSFGVATQNVVVRSGFRSPQYNARGVAEGMARSSRHQFGDAADLIIDANRDGRMDDLNNDGRVDFDDTQVIDRAVGLVEHKYPDLVGGLGLYHETGPSGPFVHIDVRGTRARWTNISRRRGASPVASRWSGVTSNVVQPSGACQAEGAMAVLCQGRR